MLIHFGTEFHPKRFIAHVHEHREDWLFGRIDVRDVLRWGFLAHELSENFARILWVGIGFDIGHFERDVLEPHQFQFHVAYPWTISLLQSREVKDESTS